MYIYVCKNQFHFYLYSINVYMLKTISYDEVIYVQNGNMVSLSKWSRVTRSVWRQWFNELLKGRMGKGERDSKVIKAYDSIGH